MPFILAIDQGTTATKSLIMDANGVIVAVSSKEYTQHYPKPGFVEHHAQEIKQSVKESILEVLALSNIKAEQIAGIGITNQRETLCVFDKNNNAPWPFIVWQCRRSFEICEKLKALGAAKRIHEITGLFLDPYFSASKILWLFEQDPSLQKKTEQGEFLLGTIDSFLCHWLSGGKLHITDVTNASRTMLMDLTTCAWSDECLDIFKIPKQALPTITKNIGPFGVTKGLDFLPDGIPISALAGDQQAALFGQCCFLSGMAKATFGTGCFILKNTGPKLVLSKHGLLSSVAYQIDGEPIYCLEGSAFIAGAAAQFLIDAFSLIKTPKEIDELALTELSSGGVIFVPALCGLGAPHWQADVRGAFFGLSRGTTRGHIARATLEGIALQNNEIIKAMMLDQKGLCELRVDGGVSNSDLLMHIQADLLGVDCIRTLSPHQTTIGIAYLAALAMGIFNDLDQIKNLRQQSKIFKPNPDRSWANNAINAYQKALSRLL